MILYHGSYMEIQVPDLRHFNRFVLEQKIF